MAVHEDNIKDLFSSKFDSFEPEVPASVWAGIDQLLSQQPPAQAPDTSSSSHTSLASSKLGTALKTALVTIGVAGSLALGVFFLYNPSDDSIVEVPVVEKPIAEDNSVENPIIQEEQQEETLPIYRPARRGSSVPTSDIEEPFIAETEEIAEGIEEEEVQDVEEQSEVEELEEAEEVEAISIPKFFKEDIALSFRANMGGLSSSLSEKGGGLLFSKNDRSTAFSDLLQEENKDYKLSHQQPISVGITASKYLTDKLSLETGLMFTYLSSKITSDSEINIEEKQTFGYLGIPIYINYEFYRLKKAKFYLSLGATMQKDIFGKYTSHFVLGDEILGSESSLQYDIIYSEPRYLKKNISQSNWQFSSHLNLGVAYPIYRKLYFYSQIGGVYYFDANNEYRTIFSDRKFQLDLNLGLRIDF